MIFLGGIVRLLFWIILVSWGLRLLGRIFSGGIRVGTATERQASDASGSVPQVSQRKLVRDPICGVHVAEVLAIPLRENGELLYFCSSTCRDKFLANTRKMAANG
jgi:YHS domain-containing protein